MNIHFNGTSRLLLILVVVLGVLISESPNVVAQPIKTTVPVSTRVANSKQNCEDLGGKFTMVDGLSNGNEELTITECDYGDAGGGQVTTCHHTPTTIDCWSRFVPVTPDSEVAAPDQADTADPWLPDPTPIVTRPVWDPSVTPVADPGR